MVSMRASKAPALNLSGDDGGGGDGDGDDGGGPGGGWRLSEVDSVLVGGTSGPAPHTEITLNRTM